MIDWTEIRGRADLAPIDQQLAELLRRNSPGDSSADLLAASAALVSRERRFGNSCLRLEAFAGAPFPSEEGDELPRLPEIDAWRTALIAGGWVGSGEGHEPLVLMEDRLYLRRDWEAERRVASAIALRLIAPPRDLDPTIWRPRIARLFPPDPKHADQPDWQAVAAIAALRRPFAVITGGPGTGKTTTVLRLLALLLEEDSELRIALAAPTGKAAARLEDSLRSDPDRFDISEVVRDRLPASVSTVHRLLGVQPHLQRFARGSDSPLSADVVLVDEASMVDLLLMDALFAALPDRARLILLGDPDQLASVDSGFVLGDLCHAADIEAGASQELATSAASLLDSPLPRCSGSGPLASSVVRLRRNYRFHEQPGIGTLSEAVRRRDLPAVRRALDEHDDIVRIDPPRRAADAIAPLWNGIESILDAASPAEALAHFARIRILCGLRRGPLGVAAFNAAVEQRLAIERGLGLSGELYPGRPILIRTNDYQTRLFNGDVGICRQTQKGLRVFFPSPEGPPRSLSPARLPDHETAWAMTVHKSQGSEFDRLLLVVPPADSPLCTRELLYTGITRARKQVWLVANEGQLQEALQRPTRRATGLVEALTR